MGIQTPGTDTEMVGGLEVHRDDRDSASEPYVLLPKKGGKAGERRMYISPYQVIRGWEYHGKSLDSLKVLGETPQLHYSRALDAADRLYQEAKTYPQENKVEMKIKRTSYDGVPSAEVSWTKPGKDDDKYQYTAVFQMFEASDWSREEVIKAMEFHPETLRVDLIGQGETEPGTLVLDVEFPIPARSIYGHVSFEGKEVHPTSGYTLSGTTEQIRSLTEKISAFSNQL
jgi:hypothetical protein